MSEFGKIHKKFHEHRKVKQCSNGAIGLWAKANAWCRDNRTAGVIPADIVLELGTTAEARELVAANLWVREQRGGGAWVAVFKDYAAWNNDVEPDTEAGNLIRKVVPESHPSAVRTQLTRQAATLLTEGIEPGVVEAGLRLWLSKDLSPSLLPSLVSQAMKEAQRATSLRNTIRQCLETGEVTPLRGYGHLFVPPIPPDGLSLEDRRAFMAAEKRKWLNNLLGRLDKVA